MIVFITAHSEQLTELELYPRDTEPIMPELAKLSWPILRKYATQGASGASLVESMPRLQEIELRVDSVAEFMEVPDRHLTALSMLRMPSATGDVLTRLRKFSRAKLMADVPEAEWSQHQDFLSRSLIYHTLRSDWNFLRRIPELRKLIIAPVDCPALPTPLPLPRLRKLSIGAENKRFRCSIALLLAHAALLALPHLEKLSLYVIVKANRQSR